MAGSSPFSRCVTKAVTSWPSAPRWVASILVSGAKPACSDRGPSCWALLVLGGLSPLRAGGRWGISLPFGSQGSPGGCWKLELLLALCLPWWHHWARGAELGFSSACRTAPRDPKSHFSLTKLNTHPPSPKTAAPMGGDAVGTTRARFDAVDPTAMARGKTREMQRSARGEVGCPGGILLLRGQGWLWGGEAAAPGKELLGSRGPGGLLPGEHHPRGAPLLPRTGTLHAAGEHPSPAPAAAPGSPASRERAADGEEQAAGREPSHLPPAL